MDMTPIWLILLAGGVLIASVYRVSPRQAWQTLRGRLEVLEEAQRRQVRRKALLRSLPDFLGNFLVGYGVRGKVLEALEFAVRLGRAGDVLIEAVKGALRNRLAESKYPALHAMARDLGDPLLMDLFHLLEQAEEEGGDIAAILEAYLDHAYQRKATYLMEQAKVLPLKLLGVTVPLLLPMMMLVMVAPFFFSVTRIWVR
jgi:pilus assembly protein TadC